jgi:hypothetical protein
LRESGCSLKVAVIQSNYLPWRGYFDLIHDVDVFVFYDDVQYTTNDWRNRNRVKTANGPAWLTVPVGNQNDRRICDVEIRDRSWTRKHWLTIEQSYRKTPGFALYGEYFRRVFQQEWTSLSTLNQSLIRGIATDFLQVTTEFRDVRDYALAGTRADRLLDLLKQIGATDYFSGPSARTYLDEQAYLAEGIRVHWKDYSTYPQYPQLYGAYEPNVSIVDLLMNCGTEAPRFIWGYREDNA